MFASQIFKLHIEVPELIRNRFKLSILALLMQLNIRQLDGPDGLVGKSFKKRLHYSTC